MKVIEKVWSDLKLEKEIGRGAYGNVYRCIDAVTGEYSAVKVISVPSSENGLVEYGTDKLSHEETQSYYKEIADDLVKEIEILKSLKGTDNIVEIYDAKTVEKEHGVGWYILIKMELLTEFKTYSANKEFTEADVLKLGMDLCSALSVCHKAKILHRDIKPENIFVDSEGNFKLGDFGVAKQMEKTQGSMSIKGTFNYMSPEVFGGKRCDNRADLYSLAIVMYKLLNNNRMPFIDKNKDTVRYSERQSAFEKRMRGDNIPPVSGVSSELNRVILKACAFNPVDRYRSAEEFASQIQHIVNGQKIKKGFKKSLLKKIIIAVSVVSLILGTGAFVCYNALKLDIDGGPDDYEEPEYVSVELGEMSSKSINGRYLYYDEDGVYLLGDDTIDDKYVKVTDTKPGNAYYDGEKVYYSSVEETYNLYGHNYKNTIYVYDVETGETVIDENNRDGDQPMYKILYREDEKIYFPYIDSANNQWLFYNAPNKVENKTDYFDHIMEQVYFFDEYIVYSEFKKLYELNAYEDKPHLISDEAIYEEQQFYKDGKLYFVEKIEGSNIRFCMYDLADSDTTYYIADFKELGISYNAEVLAMNDKYALVSDNEILSLITYGDGNGVGATKKLLNKIHFSNYIDDTYVVFVAPEISDRIVLSVEKDNMVYFYSIQENGKLAYVGKTDILDESVKINNGLIYKIGKKSETFKKYEIG